MKWLRRFFLMLFFVVMAISAAVLWSYNQWREAGPLTADKTVVLPKGMGVREIADYLQQEGVIQRAEWFLIWSVLSSQHTALKAGEYAFPAQISARDAARMIAEGKTVIRKVTVPEGYSTYQIVSLLNTTEGLSGEIGMEGLREGELLPETYFFSYGDSREEIVQRMRRDMRAALSSAWEKRTNNLPIQTPEQALTLASIVEKETGIKDERARVAAVYINRLRKGMLLQADPTILYVLTQGRYDRERLLYKDLELDSPYNTYRVTGLPPGPIANPGRAALEAVLNPLNTDEYYFVADGKGGHVFARTYAEHRRNVAAYREWMRNQELKN